MLEQITTEVYQMATRPMVNRAQREAIFRKYKQSPDGAKSYIEFRRRVIRDFDCLMLKWCGMWLGIEQDGYTHS